MFAAEPVRVESDYAKWMIDDPRINFAISTRGDKPGVDHLGIQTDTDEELTVLKAQAEAADMTLLDEGETTCCYARSEKYWVTDPQGIAWEQFRTLGDIPVFSEKRPTPAGRPRPAAQCRRRWRPPSSALPSPRVADRAHDDGKHVSHSALSKLLAEALGTALLLAIVVGSGIMAQRLGGGNVAIALLANTLATVGGLYVLVEVFGPLSGAHFNPAVTLVMASRARAAPGGCCPGTSPPSCSARMLGAWLAHAMFDLPILQFSTHLRSGPGQWIAEAVATFGLLLVILRAPSGRVAPMVAAYIGAAYWFTASTSFANPAAASGACSATASPASRRPACRRS